MNINIEHLLSQFSKKHILVIGDVMLDKYIWGCVDRISPEAPVPVVKVEKTDYEFDMRNKIKSDNPVSPLTIQKIRVVHKSQLEETDGTE